MKRDIIVSQLIKEGFSEKTLVRFSDKQLSDLHERIVTTTKAMASNPDIQKLANDPNTEVEVEEELKGKQKNIDKNHNGKIDAEDFAILNKEKKEVDVKEGDYHNERSGKALEKSKEDFPQLKNIKKCDECGKVESKCKCKKVDIKEIKNIKKCKDCGCTKSECKCKKCDKCDCTKSECKCKKEDVKEIKNWVKGLVENKEFHSFTSKNEIMELIQSKLTESNTMVQHGPKVKKGHNGIPEFMTYDAIVSAEPATKPKPTTKPGTKPGEKPKTPYQPGPGPNPKPKAMYEEKKK